MTLIPELETALVAAAQRQAERPAFRRGRLGLGRRPLAVALAALLVGGGAAVAARLAIHEGPPIPPAPAGDYAPRYHMVAPKPGTERIVATAADPVGGPDWGMRVSRGADGSPCTGVGRLHGGKIGTYDVSKRLFRALPLRGPDTCGRRVQARAVGLEGRWATEGPSQSRFVVNGLVGREVKSLTIRGPDGERPLAISPEGAFIAVFPGRLSLSDTPVTATFADGTKAVFGGRPADRLSDAALANVAQSRLASIGPATVRIGKDATAKVDIGCPPDARHRKCQGLVTIAANAGGQVVPLGSRLIRIGAGTPHRTLHFRLTPRQLRLLQAGGATQLQVSVTLDPVPNKPIEKTLALVGPP